MILPVHVIVYVVLPFMDPLKHMNNCPSEISNAVTVKKSRSFLTQAILEKHAELVSWLIQDDHLSPTRRTLSLAVRVGDQAIIDLISKEIEPPRFWVSPQCHYGPYRANTEVRMWNEHCGAYEPTEKGFLKALKDKEKRADFNPGLVHSCELKTAIQSGFVEAGEYII